jgi:hypothetical protein
MAKDFTIDLRALKVFQDNMGSRKAIGKFYRAIRATINDQAFGTNKYAKKKEIPRSMTTRGGFNQRSVWTSPARGRALEAITGGRASFSGNSGKPYEGLRHVELSGQEDTPNIPTVSGARGGVKSKKVKKSLRIKNIRPLIKLPASRPKQTLTELSKRRYRGAILIRKGQVGRGGGVRSGIYKFTGKYGKFRGRKGFEKLTLIQDTSKKTTSVRRRRKWLWNSSIKNSRPNVTLRFFARNVQRQFKSKLKKSV